MSNESGTALVESLTPIEYIEGRITGAMRRKFDTIAQKYRYALTDLGWDSFEELAGYRYHRMELGRHEASLRATINGAIERTKQPDSEALLSEMQAGQLAEHIQDVAREHAGAQAGNSPTPQKSSGGTSAHPGKTDSRSQLNHEPAKLTAYSNIKNEERLEMVNGAGQPAHVTDVCVFAEEVAKNFVLMEGFEPLCEQLEQRKTRPSLTYEEFVSNGEIPEDLWKQFGRHLYGGTPLQYRKEVLAKSDYSSRMFDKGRPAYILYETALDISDLEAAKKKAVYLQAIAVWPNDKAD